MKQLQAATLMVSLVNLGICCVKVNIPGICGWAVASISIATHLLQEAP